MNSPKILPWFALWALTTFFLFAGCSTGNEPAARFEIPDWVGSWQGIQPEYAMKDASGNVIYIQGQAAQVKSSTFIFVLQPTGGLALSQSISDGRVMEYQGRWTPIESTNYTDPVTREESALAINCELAASNGAYRNYILRADTLKHTILCYGTLREPRFELTPLRAR
tara:strand:- start:546 stop:1049 length:504 start_codon:yes stop_codon:yes gene_type:complete